MRTHSRGLARTAALLLAGALALAAGSGGMARPAAQDTAQERAPGESSQPRGQQDEGQPHRSDRTDVPTEERAAELGARVRWNAFSAGDARVDGQAAGARPTREDPVARRRAYIAANRDLLGLTQSLRGLHSRLLRWPRWVKAPRCCSSSASAACTPVSTASSPSVSATAPSTTSARRWPGAPPRRPAQLSVPPPARSRSRILAGPLPT